MKRKWLKFHTASIPAKFNVSQASSAINLDWERSWDNITINGIPFSQLMDHEEISREALKHDDGSHLKTFFKNVILKDVAPELKDSALDYLMKSFHQGGLLYPASQAVTKLYWEEKFGFGPSSKHTERKVYIITNSTGFSLQEVTTCKKFSIAPNISPKQKAKLGEDTDEIYPDTGNHYCTKAQATIKISFSTKGEKVDLQSANLSYGSKVLDTRNFIRKFIDYVMSLAIFKKQNVIEDLSQVAHQETAAPKYTK